MVRVLSSGCCWLSCQYTCQWLARKTPLRKPNRGEEIVSTKPRPNSVYDFLGLMVYCFIVLLYVCFVLHPSVLYFILLWHICAESAVKLVGIVCHWAHRNHALLKFMPTYLQWRHYVQSSKCLAISCPAFSCPAILSDIFMSCNIMSVIFSAPN